jgi:hypothetical protein
MAAIGDVDEANSAIGVAVTALGDSPYRAALDRIQNDLFDLGADLATPAGIDGALRVTPAQVARLEQEIDALNAGLAPLTSFILPGGSGDPPRSRHYATGRTSRGRSGHSRGIGTALSQPLVGLSLRSRARGEPGGRGRRSVGTGGLALTYICS